MRDDINYKTVNKRLTRLKLNTEVVSSCFEYLGVTVVSFGYTYEADSFSRNYDRYYFSVELAGLPNRKWADRFLIDLQLFDKKGFETCFGLRGIDEKFLGYGVYDFDLGERNIFDQSQTAVLSANTNMSGYSPSYLDGAPYTG